MFKSNNKGVTLVALVITIIVLLILAGVSISLIAGPNGVLTKSKTAASKTDIANAKDSFELAVAGVAIDFQEKSIENLTLQPDKFFTFARIDENLDGYKMVADKDGADADKTETLKIATADNKTYKVYIQKKTTDNKGTVYEIEYTMDNKGAFSGIKCTVPSEENS